MCADARLTAEQQAQVLEWETWVRHLARKWSRDEEYESVAVLALCEAIAVGFPANCAPRVYIWRRVHDALIRAAKAGRAKPCGDMEWLGNTRGVEHPFNCLPDSLRTLAELHWETGMCVREICDRTMLSEKRVRGLLTLAKYKIWRSQT